MACCKIPKSQTSILIRLNHEKAQVTLAKLAPEGVKLALWGCRRDNESISVIPGKCSRAECDQESHHLTPSSIRWVVHSCAMEQKAKILNQDGMLQNTEVTDFYPCPSKP
jgi:hypothetical protein